MSNEIQIVAPQSLDESERLSLSLAKSQLLPDAVRGKQSDILATVLTGAELGLAPMQSLRGIQIIKGKPTLSADTMGALCKRRSDVCEYLVLKESSPAKAVYETKRKGDPAPTTMAFTHEDATRAGLNGDNWRKYPSAMLRARALSAICRAVYPDLCLGLYDPDELAPEAPSAPPPEKDVTPTNGKRTEAVKAALQAKASAQTVDATPAAPPTPERKMPPIKDETKPDSDAVKIRKAMKAAMEKHELRGKPATDFVLRITGKAAGHDADDLARLESALNAEAAMAAGAITSGEMAKVPPAPVDEEDAPF